jgi:hypothetical protein
MGWVAAMVVRKEGVMVATSVGTEGMVREVAARVEAEARPVGMGEEREMAGVGKVTAAVVEAGVGCEEA